MASVKTAPLDDESYSFDVLKNKKEIVFFMLGELGWEVQRWSPPVNYFIKNNPGKKYIIATLTDRIDLYKDYQEHHLIKIDGLYTRKRPGMYFIYDMDPGELEGILKTIEKKYPNAYICKAPPNKLGLSVFDPSEMDFDFQPRSQNKEIINNILHRYNKPAITVSSRHRTDRDDVAKRNWNHWQELFGMLKNFTVFVAGSGEGYVRPIGMDHCFCLEDYNTKETSTIGLSIEAMRASRMTIGQQSGLPILSLQLGVPVVSWGHEKRRHTQTENPRGTHCYFFDDPEYKVSPKEVYEQILRLI